ncbi:MAG: AMP-binding protein [Oscillospiraceae bacterium]|jgi:fatty-acyl-CoA synthase|nr:AMP-binding protein [Oscillospiraceae bacterium]
MKLSYSTKIYEKHSIFDNIVLTESENARSLDGFEYAYDHVEVKILLNDASERNIVTRRLTKSRIEIPCVAVGVAGYDATARRQVFAAIEAASLLGIAHVALDAHYADADIAKLEALVGEFVDNAADLGVTLLIETRGAFADSSKLRSLLEKFANDALAVLWNPAETAASNESADTTIANLGAYVRHVRVTNAFLADESISVDAQHALRSIDYHGHLTLVGGETLADPEAALRGYTSAMYDLIHDYKPFYLDKRGTGKRIFPYDELVDLTFSRMLDRVADKFPNQTAFKYHTGEYERTYAQFRDDVDEFARSLIALGVKPGNKVAVWATNVPQWYITFWATVKIGAVLVTVNTAYKVREAEYLLRQADIQTLVMIDGYKDSDYAGIMRELCPELAAADATKPLHCKRLPFLRHIVNVTSKQDGCLTWEDALALAPTIEIAEVYRREAAISPDDVCNMQYTSGTTGYPKGVMLTHRNIVNNGKCIGDRMDLSTADRMLIHVPMFHCFGMVLAMTASISHCAAMYPMAAFSPRGALANIKENAITCFHGVPTMFIAMLEHADFNSDDFLHMRTGIMAGSPCPVPVMRDVVDKMHMSEIVIVFGQTESSPGCTMSSTDDSQELRVATVGKALPEIECKIVDPETYEDLPDETPGEFVARGYNIMKGYYKMPNATAAAIDKNGWLHTGDIAMRTPDGYYKITGRLKDMIIRGGENIYPKEIEEFLYTHPKISDVQVIGVPSEAYGEEIMACVVIKKGETLTETEVRQYVLDNMAKHKVPSYVDFVDEFPMNAAGKILKYKMRDDAVEKLGLQKAANIETA